MLIISHRGGSGTEPENTLRAFARAVDVDSKAIELDVLNVDGELVVFHDHRLERTTNGAGLVSAVGLDRLRSLDAGGGERVPLLREVLDLVNRRALVNIELKGPTTALSVAGVIEEYISTKRWVPGDFLVSSFDHPQLSAFTRRMPGIRIGALVMGTPLHLVDMAHELNAWSVHLSIEFIGREIVEECHGHGLKVLVYTVNHLDEIAWMRELGVEGVFTDFPDRALAAVTAWQKENQPLSAQRTAKVLEGDS